MGSARSATVICSSKALLSSSSVSLYCPGVFFPIHFGLHGLETAPVSLPPLGAVCTAQGLPSVSGEED